jgi:hypothetical protein
MDYGFSMQLDKTKKSLLAVLETLRTLRVIKPDFEKAMQTCQKTRISMGVSGV